MGVQRYGIVSDSDDFVVIGTKSAVQVKWIVIINKNLFFVL